MGGLLGGGGKPDIVQPKPAPKPPPVPTVDEDKVGTQAKKKRPRGRQETFLTGALVPSDSRDSKLGGGR
jgi:hypothetical protein